MLEPYVLTRTWWQGSFHERGILISHFGCCFRCCFGCYRSLLSSLVFCYTVAILLLVLYLFNLLSLLFRFFGTVVCCCLWNILLLLLVQMLPLYVIVSRFVLLCYTTLFMFAFKVTFGSLLLPVLRLLGKFKRWINGRWKLLLATIIPGFFTPYCSYSFLVQTFERLAMIG